MLRYTDPTVGKFAKQDIAVQKNEITWCCPDKQKLVFSRSLKRAKHSVSWIFIDLNVGPTWKICHKS